MGLNVPDFNVAVGKNNLHNRYSGDELGNTKNAKKK